MSNFYASYTGTNAIDVNGTITANNPSVAPTGAAVPADATYSGMNVSGNLTGLTGTSNGLKTDVQASVLPTGASTAAKQPALGTAGTASADVLTVQGITSMTPLLVTQSGSGTQQSVNVAQFGGSNVVTGTGAGGSGIPRVTVSSDSALATVTTVSAVTAITNALPAGTNLLGKFGIDQTTPGTTNGVQVNAALPAGANTIGAVTQASGPWTITGSGTAGTAASGVVTVQGIASMTPLLVTQSGSGTTQSVTATNFPTTVDTNAGAVGSSTPRSVDGGRSLTTVLANNNYASTNVTTSAYVQLISSTSVALTRIYIWNTSGSIIKIATGAALSEVDKIYLGPGGSGIFDLAIPASTRVSLEALDQTASSGYFAFTGFQ